MEEILSRAPDDFYPRPPRGGRPVSTDGAALGRKFLSTPSARRATRCIIASGDDSIFLSTPSARRATLRMRPSRGPRKDFYPRPPRGGRLSSTGSRTIWTKFLSTPSARRATGQHQGRGAGAQISIHALREEGDVAERCELRLRKISIHALREEGDRKGPAPACSCSYFYPRPPRGGRHLRYWRPRRIQQISIHALREEGDWVLSMTPTSSRYFYPRPPRGGRLQHRVGRIQSRVISIHALREEGDYGIVTVLVKAAEFLSTPSARRATPLVIVG